MRLCMEISAGGKADSAGMVLTKGELVAWMEDGQVEWVSCELVLDQEGLSVVFPAPECNERCPMPGQPGSKDIEVPETQQRCLY